MYFKKSEMTVIYNGERALDKKTLAVALGISRRINRQDLNTVRISETLFNHFLDRLGVEPKRLFDKSSRYYQEQLRGAQLTQGDWYQVLLHHPELLRGPVVLYRDKAIICHTPTDVMKVC